MGRLARVDVSDAIDWVVVGDDLQWVIDTHGGTWYDITAFPEVGKNWTTSDNGQTWDEPVITPDPPTYRTVLRGPEWIETFTEAEWAWLKTERQTNDRLDQMMDAIRWTNSVDIAVGGPMDEFYDWLLNNGLPGGQTRIDELRQGILE